MYQSIQKYEKFFALLLQFLSFKAPNGGYAPTLASCWIHFHIMLPVAAATNGALIFFWIVHANSVKSRLKKAMRF